MFVQARLLAPIPGIITFCNFAARKSLFVFRESSKDYSTYNRDSGVMQRSVKSRLKCSLCRDDQICVVATGWVYNVWMIILLGSFLQFACVM